MLYPKNSKVKIAQELFQNPTCEYRATPFWAWNCKLNKELLNQEIDYMKEMGMGGFHMHTRVGMATEYLSDDFLEFVKSCTEKAKENDMLAWLYDEDKWPSGFAGGLVTKNPKHRQKFLLFTPIPYGYAKNTTNNNDASALATRAENGYLLAKYEVILDENGFLKSYKRIAETQEVDGDIWYAYLETPNTSPWFNNQTYVDALSKEAMDEFINITHEAYKRAVGKEFGGRVPAIFTDEPQFTRKGTLNFATDKMDVILPFTTDFDETYQKAYGESVIDRLPELFWDLKSGASLTRYRYHDHVSERFAEAFADNIGGWCKQNGIMLTGHMMDEPSLQSQTAALGDAMRSYRAFELPGVDMLCDWRELTTVKQAASAAHQYGCPGVLSELYGVTNWNFDFRGHKLQGDWQAALGVTVRVPHLYWVAMGGEAKRDYPASIGHQSPWYKEYPYIEDHFARVNTLMTRGKADIKIGVIHPVESFWLHFGPKEQTADIRAELDRKFFELTDWLVYGMTDFDFICESLLPSQFGGIGEGFKVGQMEYDVILVPNCETIRSTTLDSLKQFAAKGGKVIFAGEVPTLVDAKPSNDASDLANSCRVIGWSKGRLLSELEEYRTLDIRKDNGNRADNLAYGLRADGNGKNLFICHVNHPNNKDMPPEENYKIKIKGSYAPKLYDTLNGTVTELPAEYKSGYTIIDWKCYAYSSILLRLENGQSSVKSETKSSKIISDNRIGDKVPVTLSEPNVFLLDMAEWAVDDGEWNTKEEMLRICDSAKRKLNFSLEGVGGAQPWLTKVPEEPTNLIRLKYTFTSEVNVDGVWLALENAADTTIQLNGQEVPTVSVGSYVDVSLDKVKLPSIKKGSNILILTVRFGRLTNIENSFLLGDFGVKVKGNYAEITAPVKELHFGDWTDQGLPFYGGNVTYHCTVEADGSELELKLDRFESPVITVDVDEKRCGTIALAPYNLPLGTLSNGSHNLDICVYGSRINTFGTFHNSDYKMKWFGPTAWRTKGDAWSYEYRIEPSGLLTAPRIRKLK